MVNLFDTVEEMGHEQVLFCHGKDPDIKAIIAIHDTSLGPAMGATRMLPYVNEEAALKDALRLSRGMTYKAACANIPVGGGKAVIIADPANKTEELFRAYGRFVDRLEGRFITGQDVNLTPENVRTISKETNYVVGVEEKSGGPAPITAKGVFLGIEAAVKFRLQSENLDGLKVAVQGLGNVGRNVCQLLHESGAELFVTDISQEKAEEVKRSGLTCFAKFLGTLENRLEELTNYFISRLSSGWVEGLNNKIKVLKRRSYGLSNIGNLFRRICLDLTGRAAFV